MFITPLRLRAAVSLRGEKKIGTTRTWSSELNGGGAVLVPDLDRRPLHTLMVWPNYKEPGQTKSFSPEMPTVTPEFVGDSVEVLVRNTIIIDPRESDTS